METDKVMDIPTLITIKILGSFTHLLNLEKTKIEEKRGRRKR